MGRQQLLILPVLKTLNAEKWKQTIKQAILIWNKIVLWQYDSWAQGVF